MNTSYRFEIPFPAVVKKNNRNIGFNRRTGQRFPIKGQRLIDYEINAQACLTAQLAKINKSLPLLTGKVKAVYAFYFKKRSRADWDNLPAALQDCAQQVGIFANDKQIKVAAVQLIEDSGEKKTIVEYSEL